MPTRLDSSAADFEARFDALLAQKREASADVEAAVRAIIDDVIARGDAAVIEATRKFDHLDLTPAMLRVPTAEIDAAEKQCERKTLDALKLARDRIEAFHKRQLPKDDRFTDALGVELGARWTAIDAVGLYVPGGSAAYPSSVLMNAVPASVAGVKRVVMVVPSPEGRLNPLVLAAAKLAGVSRDLPRRRRPGGGRARLRHGDDRAGRQDRRPRQCLCRRRQAPRFRQGRHRHDRRPVRGAGDRRRQRQPGMDRR